jgi:uncharacterized protein YbjT (DUF2867 family)
LTFVQLFKKIVEKNSPTLKLAIRNVGSATVKYLAARFGSQLDIVAGVRDPTSAKADALKIENVTVVAADMAKPETLQSALAGAHGACV